MSCLFLTATGTDVGKTYISGELVSRLREAGLDAGYYKFVLSGAATEPDLWQFGDAEYVRQRAGLPESAAELVSYAYGRPVSPHLAVKMEGHPPDLESLRRDFAALQKRHTYTLIEGCGNLYCPLCEEPFLEQSELVHDLGLSTILVAPSGLGALGAIASTLALAQAKAIPVLALVLNRFDEEDLICNDNLRYCQTHFHLPVFPCPENGEIAMSTRALKGLFAKGEA